MDRLGRTVRDTLNLIHELTDRGVGLRNLADPIRVDNTNPADPMSKLAVVHPQWPAVRLARSTDDILGALRLKQLDGWVIEPAAETLERETRFAARQG